MTLGLKNIWDSLNRFLSVVNAAIWTLSTWVPSDFKKIKDKKNPLIFNVLLFLILVFLLIIMTYGSFRRQTD